MPNADCKLERTLDVMEVETFGRGGLTHYAYNLSCALADRGHRVSLVTSVGYELADAETPPGVEVVRQTARWTQGRDVASALGYKLEALADAASVAWRAWRSCPDVVHIHSTNPILLVHLLLLRLVGIVRPTKVVATAHVVTPHEVPNPRRLQRLVIRLIHWLPHLVVAHSEFDRRRLVDEFGVRAERTVMIPHGEYGFFERAQVDEGSTLDAIEARRGLGLEADDEVALFFGYLREYKGLDVLLDAWRMVRSERPAARLVIAGDPVQLPAARRRELEAEARRLGAICRFDYVPFSDVPRYFAAADALVMPYRRISQSGVLFLALSLGVPVVATRVGGLPEMLDDGDSALLVPPEDPSSLANALVRVLANGALRERLSEGGLRVADEHSWASIAEQTERALSAGRG